jgi:hypothetical protein
MTEDRKNCLLGEAYFLRGFYYFQLVRVFGGVPLVDDVIDSSEQWQQPRATVDAVYEHIISDLTKAESLLWNRSKYTSDDLGRATKGAAQAMLCKAYLYHKDYDNAYTWGKKWVEEQYNKEYSSHLQERTAQRAYSRFSIWKIPPPTMVRVTVSHEAHSPLYSAVREHQCSAHRKVGASTTRHRTCMMSMRQATRVAT